MRNNKAKKDLKLTQVTKCVRRSDGLQESVP